MIRFSDQHRKTYRYKLEEGAERSDPYGWHIMGVLGDIYVAGDNIFGVSTHKRGPLVGKLHSLPFTRITQDGDDGANFVFAAEHLDAIAKLVGARRRRRLSPERRAMAVERLRKYAFRPASGASGAGQRQLPSDQMGNSATPRRSAALQTAPGA